MILMSDGEPSPWAGGLSGTLAKAEEVKANNITLFAVGFGSVSKSTLDSIATPPANRYSQYSSNGLMGIIEHFRNNLCPLIGSTVTQAEPSPVPSYASSFLEKEETDEPVAANALLPHKDVAIRGRL